MKRASLEIQKSHAQSGQVEVETAIVLPMVVFLLLGLIQLGLLHQARLMAEYAAYRAVRAGALNNLDLGKMEDAAVAAALPILSYANGNTEVLSRTSDAGSWANKYNQSRFRMNWMGDVPFQYAEIVICGPLRDDVSAQAYSAQGKQYLPFDRPEVAGRGIQTKLRIQLTLNYRMIIPFADWVIYRMWKGKEIATELHLGRTPSASISDKYDLAAFQGVHIIPIRAQYAMKIHSDVELTKFPDTNQCL